jgi:hypothetical protein
VSRRQLVLQSLGLPQNDKRIPVRKIHDRLFEDCTDQQWTLVYVEGGVTLRAEYTGVQLAAEHLSDLVVFYSEHEFANYLKKISDGKLG